MILMIRYDDEQHFNNSSSSPTFFTSPPPPILKLFTPPFVGRFSIAYHWSINFEKIVTSCINVFNFSWSKPQLSVTLNGFHFLLNVWSKKYFSYYSTDRMLVIFRGQFGFIWVLVSYLNVHTKKHAKKLILKWFLKHRRFEANFFWWINSNRSRAVNYH